MIIEEVLAPLLEGIPNPPPVAELARRSRVRRLRRRWATAVTGTGLAVVLLAIGLSTSAHSTPGQRLHIGAAPAPPPTPTPGRTPNKAKLPPEPPTTAVVTTLPPVPDPFGAPVAARLVTPQIGWIVTSRAVLRTADGGKTWRHLLLPNLLPNRLDIPSVSIVDANTAWVAFARANSTTVSVLRTDDGDRTLVEHDFTVGVQPRPGFVNVVAHVSALDAIHAFVDIATYGDNGLSGGALYRTDDGDRSWSLISASAQGSTPTFISSTIGWLTGNGLYRTGDGGHSWQRLHPPGWSDQGVITGKIGPEYRVLYADSHELAIESALYGGLQVQIHFLVSYDGGSEWTDITPHPNTSYGGTGPQPGMVSLGGGRYRVLIGAQAPDTDVLASSNDGGRTYADNATGLYFYQPRVLSFSDATHGWAAGNDYECPTDASNPGPCPQTESAWATSDGGKTWTQLSVPAIPG